MVSTVGPVSNRYPSTASWPIRPPGPSARSSTVTCRPVPASRRAQARPPSPAPTMTTFSVGPVTVRIEFLRLGTCRPAAGGPAAGQLRSGYYASYFESKYASICRTVTRTGTPRTVLAETPVPAPRGEPHDHPSHAGGLAEHRVRELP